MNCPFGAFYELIECGEMSECKRNDKHHHHKSTRTVEVITGGTADECWNTYFGRNKK